MPPSMNNLMTGIKRPMTLENFVNGQFVSPITQKYIDSLNPATGETLCQVPDSGAEDVNNAVQTALDAFPNWSKTTRRYRADLMHRLANLIESNKQDLAEAESMDQGKTLKQALSLEIPRCATNFKYYADLLVNFHDYATETEIPIPTQSVIKRDPIGVVGIISPWNLPLYLLTWKIAPALAMGNCVVAKPSEFTSLTAFKLCELAKDAGFPDGVLNVVFGKGESVGQAIVEHPSISAIGFTGGTVTGRKIASSAATLGKKVSLELGGKNPSIIFSDCDLDEAVSTSVKAAFSNQGEICLCSSRVYVERSIYDEFLNRFISQTASLKVGNPLDPNTDLGAVVSKAHMDKIMSYIDLARSEKASIHCGGSIPTAGSEKGFFVSPTIISGISQNSRLMKEEIFGPVVCVSPFDTEEEAIRLANDVDYGLAASVWTRDGKKGQRTARQIKAGVVWINCWMVRDLATPFGGIKASGYGREGGTYALEFFSDIKTITTAL